MLSFGQCGRSIAPIISGCDGPTERILQSTAQKQDSYLKDTTNFLNFIASTKLPKNTVPVSMDGTILLGLYTNIPHEEGVTIVCQAYKDFKCSFLY